MQRVCACATFCASIDAVATCCNAPFRARADSCDTAWSSARAHVLYLYVIYTHEEICIYDIHCNAPCRARAGRCHALWNSASALCVHHGLQPLGANTREHIFSCTRLGVHRCVHATLKGRAHARALVFAIASAVWARAACEAFASAQRFALASMPLQRAVSGASRVVLRGLS